MGEGVANNAEVGGESGDTGHQQTFISPIAFIHLTFLPSPTHIHPTFLSLSDVIKCDRQALSSFGFQFITEQFLPRKLLEGDWI